MVTHFVQASDNPFFRSPWSFLHQATQNTQSLSKSDIIADDSDLIRAVRDQRNVYFIEAKGVTVVRLLSDDVSGERHHQRWFIRLSSGRTVFCAYNIDLAENIPLKTNDVINVGGEFIWSQKGPVLHWLHVDPKQRRPAGYVDLKGIRYGQLRRPQN
jgi:hypothetical protein